MTKSTDRVWRKAVSVVTAFALAFTMCPASALADEQPAPEPEAPAEKTINYVSLGDSMTNGYGLSGYDNNGINKYGANAYPNQFEEYLEGKGYTVNHDQLAMSAMRAEDLHFILEFPVDDENALAVADRGWNSDKYAEAYEWWIGEYADVWNSTFSTGDYYTWDEFCNNGRFRQNCGLNGEDSGNTKLAAEMYQNAVANADIISLGVGNANFGVFLMGRAMNAIGALGSNANEDAWIDFERALAECDEETKAQVMELKAELDKLIAEKLASLEGTALADKIDPLINAITYTVLSYVLNYAGSVEAILALNPDAEIMLVGIMNTFAGMNMTITAEDGSKVTIPMNNIFKVISEPINTYIAALPAAMQAAGNGQYDEAVFYYAEAPEVECMVSTYEGALKDSDSVVRWRFIEEIVGVCDHSNVYGNQCKDALECMDWDEGMVWPMVKDMFGDIEQLKSMGIGLEGINLGNIQAYEAGNLEGMNPSQILSCAVYLAFEKAIITGSKNSVIPLDSFTTLAEGLDGVFGGVGATLMGSLDMDAVANSVTEQVMAAGTEEVTKWASNSENAQVLQETAGKLAQLMQDPQELDQALVAQVAFAINKCDLKYDFTSDPTEPVTKALTEYFTAKYAPHYTATTLGKDLTSALSDALTGDATVMGLLHLFGRMLIGNGLGAHPSAAGHDDLAAAVKTSYENGYTAKDETIKNIDEAAKAVADIVAEYYDEAYAYAYGEAKAAGYIDQVINGLDDVKTYLDQAAKWAADNKANMSEELFNDLTKAIENAKKTVSQMQVLINEADVLDNASFVELMNLVALLNQNLSDIATMLNTAGSDLGNAAWEIYVNDIQPVLEQLAQDTYEFLLKKADEAYKAFVEAAKWAAQELPGKAADAIYNYLLNNPEEVIAFINQYGPDFVKFIQDNHEPILAVLGWLAKNYGDDVLNYVMAHPDEILNTMVTLYEKHGENAWKLIKVYADALGVTAAVEQQIAILEQQIDQLKAQLEDALAKLDAQLAEAIHAKIAYIEAQIAQLEALLDQINQCIAEGKAKVDAAIAEINRIIAEINDCIAQIQDAIADLEAQLADLKAQAEELYKQLQAAIAKMEKAMDAIQDAIDEFMGALEDLPENAEEAYQALVDYLKQLAKDQANKAAQWLYEYVMNNAEAVVAMLKAFGEDALAYVQEHIDAILDTVNFLLEKFGEDVTEYLMANGQKMLEYMVYLVENFGDEAWDMIVTLVDASGIVDYVNAEVADATHGEYAVTPDSYYLALGDSNATGMGLGKRDATYAELLAAELGLSEDQFSDLTVDGLRTQDLRAILDADYQMDAYGKALFADLLDEADLYASEIAKADLITVSTGADNLTAFVSEQVMNAIMGKDTYEMNWAAFVGKDNVKNVEAILADVNAYFQENGLDAQTAQLMTFVVEAYAYGYFGFAFNYTEVVNDIRGINPDAQIVLVGMFNPINQMVIDLPNGEQFAFGEYVDYFVDLTDAQFITYATTTDNVTFVAVPDTQVFFDEKVDPTTAEYLLELLFNSAEELRPDAAGHQYIKEQILKAMTISKSLKDAKVAVEDVVYNAKVQTPAVSVTVDGKELVQGEDFTVEYQNNVQVGTATAVITGKGAYNGQLTADFAIKHFATADSFKDFVADAWYLSEESNRGAFDGQKTLYLDYILATGIMNGYKKDSTTDELTGLFGPNDKLKRADAATILYRVANPDSTDTTVSADYAKNQTNLPDVEDDRYYTAAVNWCVEQGIITGYKGNDKRAGKFVPNGNVTREELATMVYRFCVEYMGVEATAADITGFKDYGKIHEYALDAMAFCNAEKIMAGRIDANGNRTKVDPRGNATRAEASKMLAVSVRDVAQL